MKLCIILILFYGYICHGNEIWYQTEMSTYLVPPFQSVYTTLQNNILDKLLTIDSNSLTTNDGALTSFASNLHCEVEKLLKYLDVAVGASNNIRINVDRKLATISNDISVKESEIARTDGQIRDINSKIQAKRSQITAGEQSVRQAEGLAADAQNALHRAEQEVEDAKLCSGLIGRRRKRFIGNLWNSIQTSVLKPIESAANTAGGAIQSAINTAGGAIVDNIVKPVCSVINFQQLDNARRNVENKKNDLSSFRNQVQTLKNDLNSLQNDLVKYDAQSYNLNYQLNQLKNSLIALPNEQHIILSINQKLTDVVSHIRTLLGGSTSFLDAMTIVSDFQSVVKPLNTIYDELQQNQFMVSFNPGKISMAQTNQAKISLQALIASIPSTPLNMGGARCSN
jgi:peptidoglycan hydrolase CwlO-like protein